MRYIFLLILLLSIINDSYSDSNDNEFLIGENNINSNHNKIAKDEIKSDINKNNTIHGDKSRLLYSSYIGSKDLEYLTSVNTKKKGFLVSGYMSKPSENLLHEVYLSNFNEKHDNLWQIIESGSKYDISYDIIELDNGNIAQCGISYSDDYPITENLVNKSDNYDINAPNAIFSIYSKDQAIYSAIIGGDNHDRITSIAVEGKYIWGVGSSSSSNNYITTNANKENNTGTDGILFKFDVNEKKFVYFSYFGSEGYDIIRKITLDSGGNPVICGFTENPDLFPDSKSEEFIEHSGNLDGFVAKIDKDSYEVIWGTYLGGSKDDGINSMDIDNNDNILVCGATHSEDFFVKNAFQNEITSDNDFFITSLKGNGKINWSTYLGANNDEGYVHRQSNFNTSFISVNEHNYIAFNAVFYEIKKTDRTIYSNKPIGNTDIVTYILSEHSDVLVTSFYGGTGGDTPNGIDFKNNKIYIAGRTFSNDLPITKNAIQKNYGGSGDGFISVLSVGLALCENNYFHFPDFSNTNDLHLSGNSISKNNTLFLTESKENQTGTAWYNEPMPVRDGFVTTFSFRLTDGFNNFVFDGSSPGADGLAFVIQNHLPDAIGNGGAGVGYEGIPNSLAVEFDTYNNERQQYDETDPNGNHIAIQSNGIEANSTDHSGSANMGLTSDIPELRADSTVYYAMIDYSNDGNKLQVWLSDNPDLSSENPVLETDEFDLYELLELFDNHKAYVGFTSSTGASHENHELLSWEFCSNEPEENYTSVETQSESKRLVYPNPTSEIVTIEAEVQPDNKYYLMDIEGRVYDNERIIEKPEGIEVNLKGLSNGVYFLRIMNSKLENSKDYKIIKK